MNHNATFQIFLAFNMPLFPISVSNSPTKRTINRKTTVKLKFFEKNRKNALVTTVTGNKYFFEYSVSVRKNT